MENSFDFEIFETPEISKEEIEQKQAEKAERIAKNSRKNTAIKAVSTVCAVLISIAAILCIYLYTAPSHNPQRLAEKYINEINSGKWEKAYSRLYFDKSTPIYDESYINFCKENPNEMALAPGKIIDFEINKNTEANDDLKSDRIFYSVDYVLEDGSHGTFYLTAENTNGKTGRLAKYGILPSQRCFAALKIKVPASTEVYVKGIRFTEPVYENGSCIYEIGYTFADTNDIRVVNPYCSEINEMLELKAGENFYDFTPEITEECYNSLCKQTQEHITSLYNDVINGSTDFGKYRLLDSYKNSGFNEDIEKIKADVFIGNYTVSDFRLEDARLKKAFADIDKKLSCTENNEIEIKYDFSYSYTVTFDGADGKSVSQERKGSGYFSVKYILSDDWYINGISAHAWF